MIAYLLRTGWLHVENQALLHESNERFRISRFNIPRITLSVDDGGKFYFSNDIWIELDTEV